MRRFAAMKPVSSELHLLRRTSLVLLLIAEVLLITLALESPAVEGPQGVAGWLLEHASSLGRIAVVVAAALALLLSPRAATLLTAYGADTRRTDWGFWLLAQLVTYAAFYTHTDTLFDRVAAGAAATSTDAALWLAHGSIVLFTWALAVAPARTWGRFLLDERRALLVSACAGVVAFAGGQIAQRHWRPLAEWTLALAHRVLGYVYSDVTYDPVVGTVGTKRIVIEIAPQCSGYEGVALIIVFLCIYLWLFRAQIRFPRALVLFPVGVAAIWLSNVLRIAAIVVVGTEISPQIAVQGFHSQAGWITFTAIALGLVWVAHRFVLRGSDASDAEAREARSLAAALLVPMLVLMASSLIAAAFSAGFAVLYPLGVIATAAALWSYRATYRAMPLALSWEAVGLGVLVFVVWLALESGRTPQGDHLAAYLGDLAPALALLWLVFRVLGSVVIVPIAEELAFRGYLIRKLVSVDFARVAPGRFTWMSFIVSSLLFGLLHGRWLAGAIAGAFFAVALYRRGRLVDAVTAHVTANALIAIAVLGFGRWSLWT
jgi:exosortase E/protease (VPEID-CTERM system)